MRLTRIITLIAVFAILCSFFVSPAGADGSVSLGLDVVEAADWLLARGNQTTNSLLHVFDKDVCSANPTTVRRHDFIEQRTQVSGKNGLYYICKYCGQSAGEVMNGTTNEDGTTTSGAYQEYVASLPSNGYSSDGSILWHPTIDDLYGVSLTITEWRSSGFSAYKVTADLPFTSVTGSYYSFSRGSNDRSFDVHSIKNISFGYFGASKMVFSAPFSGSFKRLEGPAAVAFCIDGNGSYHSFSAQYGVTFTWFQVFCFVIVIGIVAWFLGGAFGGK